MVADSLQWCLGCAGPEFCDSFKRSLKHHQPVEEKPTQLMLFWGRRGFLGVTKEGDVEGKDGRNGWTMLHGERMIP